MIWSLKSTNIQGEILIQWNTTGVWILNVWSENPVEITHCKLSTL